MSKPRGEFHGRDDTTVPYLTSELFAEKMKEKGNRCELVGYPGQTHGFFNSGRADNKYFIDTVRKMDAFLVVGLLSIDPTIRYLRRTGSVSGAHPLPYAP